MEEEPSAQLQGLGVAVQEVEGVGEFFALRIGLAHHVPGAAHDHDALDAQAAKLALQRGVTKEQFLRSEKARVEREAAALVLRVDRARAGSSGSRSALRARITMGSARALERVAGANAAAVSRRYSRIEGPSAMALGLVHGRNVYPSVYMSESERIPG